MYSPLRPFKYPLCIYVNIGFDFGVTLPRIALVIRIRAT